MRQTDQNDIKVIYILYPIMLELQNFKEKWLLYSVVSMKTAWER